MVRTADPVQAARKAAIKCEAKRNRERRAQAQEARILRQDTTVLERQIQRLESKQSTLEAEDQQELKRLQAEVANVKRVKEEYIRKHPDQRNFVRGYEDGARSSSNQKINPPSPSSTTSQTQAAPSIAQSTQRDPRWSIYYDPVFNPYGAPPPGMPYLEKSHVQLVAEGLLDAAKPPPLPEETAEFQGLGSDDDSDDSSIDEDLKDIVMPAGPPPIRLLPGHEGLPRGPAIANSKPTRGRGREHGRGGRGRGVGPSHHQGGRHGPYPNQHGGTRPNHNPSGLPPRPPTGPSTRPPPPMAAANASPLRHPAPTSGPPKPPGPPPSIPDGVVISAEPQLRDFKKESTAFVPAALRKKQQEEKARLKRGLPGRIDAAPISEDMPGASPAAAYKDKPDLLKSLQAHLPSKGAGAQQESGSNSSKKEYDQFLDEVGDLL
ncbi:hypothetical protein NDA16_004610 [Ustilago loliicola]|nr:hypothetical protein NDA16_004610 [Ustilago loliicola]